MKAPDVSMVEKAAETETHDANAEAIVRAIGSDKWRTAVEAIRRTFERVLKETGDHTAAKKAVDPAKKKLPAIQWSGRFSSRDKPAANKLIQHSGLLCADLDGLGDSLTEVRQKLITSPHLWVLFLSPTGDGLKGVFRVPADAAKHPASFRAVEHHVRELTDVTIDGSRKDLAGLCFVSHDPDLYHNANAVELSPLVEVEKPREPAPWNASPCELETRRRIAAELVGEIEWTTETSGYCVCPGHHLHTTGGGERDCELRLDGAPTLHCFHNSCTGICAGVNHELRRRIGKAECALRTPNGPIHSVERFPELPPVPPLYSPPPLTLLPIVLRDYIQTAAKSLNVDVTYILLPLLSALGSAIGDSRSILLKTGFVQPPIIWSGIIGRSGSRKSPALDAGCFAVLEHERELTLQNKAAASRYGEDLAEWERKPKKDRGTKPEPSLLLTCLMDDLTLAALAGALDANRRGVLVKKDELSHWFAAMDQFHDGKGSDVSRWLSLHTGVFFGLDRKTDKLQARLWHPRVCITGGIQPAVLARVLTQDFFERGLPARFLFAAPPGRPDRWSEHTVDERLRSAVVELFENLYELEPVQMNDEACPIQLKLGRDAKDAFVFCYNECGAAAEEADERGEAAWSKLSGYAARLALVGQLSCDPHAEIVTGGVMAAACELARWFGSEALRIYATMSETVEQSSTRRLVEFIERRGGAVTVRDVVTNYWPLKNRTKPAEEALAALQGAGYGDWKGVPATPKGGKPTREFRLRNRVSEPSASAIPTGFPRGERGYADADAVEACNSRRSLELEEAFF